MDDVKQEPVEFEQTPSRRPNSPWKPPPDSVVDLSSSSDSEYSSSDESEDENGAAGNASKKRRKLSTSGVVLPDGFLDLLPPPPQRGDLRLADPEPKPEPPPLPIMQQPLPIRHYRTRVPQGGSKQFWKAGDYEDSSPLDAAASSRSSVGMDHVRVHPKFLHSNATSHKWALGAFAELLDNALDEVVYGATFVSVDMVVNDKDGSRMLLFEDDGGGMDPDKMRQCMSLGYSAKSKMANVIGQYGNGFKTSTMRLGADVLVFSRSPGKDGKCPTQSIGMLSYTFLRGTRKEDIVVPMLDYLKVGPEWTKLMRSSQGDWDANVEAILQWSPYSSEAQLFHQFRMMGDHGTRIIIYNLWEDDQGELELDFDTDPRDIQIRGVNRDEKKIEMASHFPNSRHFLTYRHSLRSYASILYLRVPNGFRFVLRGQDVEHHNIVTDMFLTQEITYKPQPCADGGPKHSNMVAVVTVGFVKDAKDHVDVQGFNVYHKNRLIKPFWRVWNSTGSDGRGVIGVLEANFVEPAHDKQGFERTTVLARLEARLVQMQKTYWSSLCHKIGYAPRRQKKLVEAEARESSPDYSPYQSKFSKTSNGKHSTGYQKQIHGQSPSTNNLKHGSRVVYNNGNNDTNYVPNGFSARESQNTNSSLEHSNFGEVGVYHASNGGVDSWKEPAAAACNGNGNGNGHADARRLSHLEVENFELREKLKNMEDSFSRDLESQRGKNRLLEAIVNGVPVIDSFDQSQLKMENHKLEDSLKQTEESYSRELQYERDRCKSLEAQLKESEGKIEEMNREQEALIDIFQEERNRRNGDEENLREKLREASDTIQQLRDRVKQLEMLVCKQEGDKRNA